MSLFRREAFAHLTNEELEEHCEAAGLYFPSLPFTLNGIRGGKAVQYSGKPDANYRPNLPEDIDSRAVGSFARALARGIVERESITRAPVLGDSEWESPDDPDFPLPDDPTPVDAKYGACVGMRIPRNGYGHIQFHQNATIGFLRCQLADCDDDFTVVRGKSSKARWPQYCSPECRADAKRQADRERLREKRMSHKDKK